MKLVSRVWNSLMGKIGFIYLTTNKVNNKKYIGQRHYHCNSKADDRYLGSGLLILKAIRKYGAENFSREILEECETQEELDLAEKNGLKNIMLLSIGISIILQKAD